MKNFIGQKIFFVLFFSLLSAGVLAQSNRVLAVVNGEVLTSKDLESYRKIVNTYRVDNFLNDQQEREKALTTLIEDKLILQEAKKEGIEVPASWLDEKIAQLAAAYPDYQSFSQSLKGQGISLSHLRRRLKEQYLTRRIIDQKVRAQISILPGKISQYYQENREDFKTSPRALFLMSQSNQESELETLAYFIDRQGIDKTWDNHKQELSKFDIYLDQLQESLEEVLLELEDGSYKITKIKDKFYLLYRKAIKPPQALSLAQVQEKIYQELWKKEFTRRFNQWVDLLREAAVIKIYSFLAPQD